MPGAVSFGGRYHEILTAVNCNSSLRSDDSADHNSKLPFIAATAVDVACSLGSFHLVLVPIWAQK